jgi:hypothetical protein
VSLHPDITGKKLRTLTVFWISLFALTFPACYSSSSPSQDRILAAEQPAEDMEASPEGKNTISLERPVSIAALATGKTKPPEPEEFGEQLQTSGRKWLYGGGLGRTMVNVGTVVVFPPYVLYLLGNASLALAGYEPLHVTSLLPERPRQYVDDAFDAATSVPGRTVSFVAGEEYQSN